jgi:hypothetical protein
LSDLATSSCDTWRSLRGAVAFHAGDVDASTYGEALAAHDVPRRGDRAATLQSIHDLPVCPTLGPSTRRIVVSVDYKNGAFMEPRGCKRWQTVAIQQPAESAETRENRCRRLRPIADTSAW